MNTRDPSVATGILDPTMPDVQGSVDHRRQPIQRVGVRGLRYPLLWRTGAASVPTVAMWGLFVALPADQKGTHMSRFIALLENSARELSLERLVPLHRHRPTRVRRPPTLGTAQLVFWARRWSRSVAVGAAAGAPAAAPRLRGVGHPPSQHHRPDRPCAGHG